jgi:hypothetical protein
METPVELIPLNCLRCGTPIPAEIDEFAWACAQCEQGQQLGDQGLIPLEIHYSQTIADNLTGNPFWVCEGRVTIRRDTYGRAKSEKDAQKFWSQPRKFIIPAFSYPVDQFAKNGIRWLQKTPTMNAGPVVRFAPVTVAVDDVTVWAEFLVVALEAERKDKVKKLDFELALGNPALWILPLN